MHCLTLPSLSLFLLSASAAPGMLYPRANSSTSSTSKGSGCPPNLKGVTFNGGYDVSQFDKISAADSWLSFGLSITGSPSSGAKAAHVPMMAFASDVARAVDMVNGGDAPDWMLTFNEPDFSYMGFTPMMTPEEAAAAIKPLLAKPGTKTKFVAPVTADPHSDWLPKFYSACNCKDFFSAYNIHIYTPTSQSVFDGLATWRSKFGDKPTWITEIAPGNAVPTCSLSPDVVGKFMDEVYSWAKGSGWVERVFWNTGNRIDGGDTNVCDSWLLGGGGEESALLGMYRDVGC